MAIITPAQVFKALDTAGERTAWSDDSMGMQDVVLDGRYDLNEVAAALNTIASAKTTDATPKEGE